MSLYSATPKDVAITNDLMARMKRLLGEPFTQEPLEDITANVATMIHGHIEFPTPYREARLIDKTLVRYKTLHVHINAYKVDAMPVVAYFINFSRLVDRRGYRCKNWDINRDASKVFVSGHDADEVWDKFLEKFKDCGIKDLSDTPGVLSARYCNTL